MINQYKIAITTITLLLSTSSWSFCFNDLQATKNKPDNIYAIHGDGTVTDLQTGLMWSQCEAGKSGENCESGSSIGFTSWEDALQYARDSELAGYSDWRMPNIKELDSLTEKSCTDPAINTQVFKAAQASILFSSTVRVDGASYYVWAVDSSGNIRAAYKNPTGGATLRLVRSGNKTTQ